MQCHRSGCAQTPTVQRTAIEPDSTWTTSVLPYINHGHDAMLAGASCCS